MREYLFRGKMIANGKWSERKFLKGISLLSITQTANLLIMKYFGLIIDG